VSRTDKLARIIVGGVLFAAGMTVTVVTYLSPAESGESRYFLATGAIVAGLVTLVRGLL
jgi:hypothetical protein